MLLVPQSPNGEVILFLSFSLHSIHQQVLLVLAPKYILSDLFYHLHDCHHVPNHNYFLSASLFQFFALLQQIA